MTTTPHSIPRTTREERNRLPAIRPRSSILELVLVYAALLLLLAGSALSSYFQLGAWVLVISLVVSVTQMLLIMLFFMHVRFASRLTWVFASVGFVWLAILFGLTLSDYLTRMWIPRMDDIAPQQQLLPTPPGLHPQSTPAPHRPLHYQPDSPLQNL